MSEKLTPKEPDIVACDMCLKEIPESVAVSSEGDEYTQHFCGIECYQKWRTEKDTGQQPRKADDA